MVEHIYLKSRKITALPIIDHYLRRMGVEDMFSGRIEGGGSVSHTQYIREVCICIDDEETRANDIRDAQREERAEI